MKTGRIARVPKDAYINMRVDRQLKIRAEKLLRHVGVTTTDAVTMLLHQIILHKGLPFDVRVPNKETQAAMRSLMMGKGEVFDTSTADVFDRVTQGRD